MWWIVGIVVVLIALSIVAAVRRHRTGKQGNTQLGQTPLGHTQQNKSIGYFGEHL
jgi:hypothetical protein